MPGISPALESPKSTYPSCPPLSTILIVAAVILMLSDRFVSGMTVNGFGGAIIAAIAIAVVYWIVTWLLGLLGIQVSPII